MTIHFLFKAGMLSLAIASLSLLLIKGLDVGAVPIWAQALLLLGFFGGTAGGVVSVVWLFIKI